MSRTLCSFYVSMLALLPMAILSAFIKTISIDTLVSIVGTGCWRMLAGLSLVENNSSFVGTGCWRMLAGLSYWSTIIHQSCAQGVGGCWLGYRWSRLIMDIRPQDSRHSPCIPYSFNIVEHSLYHRRHDFLFCRRCYESSS
jgi:hypothetical protein